MYKVILVDDEPWSLKGIQQVFKWSDAGFEIVLATTDAEEALEKICSEEIDAVFTDVRMPELSGLELMSAARKKGASSEFVFISGFAEFQYVQQALKEGAFDYFLKPIPPEEAAKLLIKLHQHLDQKRNLKSLLDSIAQKESEEPVPADAADSFKDLVAYVNTNFAKDLYLKELAERFHIGFTYTSALFKKHLNKNFSEYVSDLRMKKAQQLLLETSFTLEEISSQVGYNDYYYFNRLFKKYYGVPPHKYRTSILKGDRLENSAVPEEEV